MSAVETLRSPIGPAITSYLALKTALGRRFTVERDVLAHLDRFLAGRASGGHSASFTAESFAAWCLTFAHLSPTVRRNWMRIARNLCLYRRRSDPNAFVPDPAGFPAPSAPQRPHIFTEQEIRQTLRAASGVHVRGNSPLAPAVFRLALVLLYTAGLRRGEVVRLVISDYDPAERTLRIRASKFHKTRLVALSSDAAREVESYLQARRGLPRSSTAEHAPLLVTGRHGRRAYSGMSLANRLRAIFRHAGIRTERGRAPRVHDLRHTYAVHALLRWYRAGLDVQAKLPALATAMGHVSIASTAYYLAFLTAVAEAASERFARHAEDALAMLAPERGDQ
jgi:integrase/recombinase XerD